MYHEADMLTFDEPDLCRDCGQAHTGIDCPESAQLRDWRGDRWQEAVLGARLRFHATTEPEPLTPERFRYWQAVYVRWADLYHGRDPRVPGGYAYER